MERGRETRRGEERPKASQAEPAQAAEAIRKVDAELLLEAGRSGWAMRNSHYARGLGATLKAPTGLQRPS